MTFTKVDVLLRGRFSHSWGCALFFKTFAIIINYPT